MSGKRAGMYIINLKPFRPGVSMQSNFILPLLAFSIAVAAATNRYEAENAIVDENSVQKVADAAASGGYYVNMKEGALSFTVTAGAAGFYTLWTCYSEPFDAGGKIQNLTVNGLSKGQISFPFCSTFVTAKASAKIKLAAGSSTIGIVKSWGWVNIDYIELTPYVETPFTISTGLVTPNASENARKMYGFLRENFQKKIVSGVMTNTVMRNDGNYTPDTVEEQTEVAWIINASHKTPALLGLDFMHSTGKNSENEWFRGYTNATLSLAENIYKKGGFPAYCWHWKDPSKAVEAFYSKSSGTTPFVEFNLNKAFVDSTTCAAFNTNSAEYKAIIGDLDIIAGYLKTLADKGIPVLWRPMHEASGKWFWWGYSGAKACVALYKLMFQRFTVTHGLNNLVWVWTTDEAGDALDWYPGDDCVDIVGRDYYYYPREANHGSLVASFEKVKEIYGGKKIVALSENGSIPHPDSLTGDGAGWSYFMPWYGDYTMENGWMNDNTAAGWNSIMNHAYVITLDKMPGWDRYVITPMTAAQLQRGRTAFSISQSQGSLEIHLNARADAVELYDLQGTRVAALNKGTLAAGTYRFSLKGITLGMYLVRIGSPRETVVAARPVLVR
jgi:mannan endo-1,4-beta-mannosidase